MFGVGKLALGDEDEYLGGQSMDTLIRELADVREELIPEVPEMLFGLNICPSSIKGKPGHPLTLWGDGAIVYEGHASPSVFVLKHHHELFPASIVVISFLSVDVEGFQVIYSPGIEDVPVLQLMVGVKVELMGFLAGVWTGCLLVGKGIVVEYQGTCLGVWGLNYKGNMCMEVFMWVMCKGS